MTSSSRLTRSAAAAAVAALLLPACTPSATPQAAEAQTAPAKNESGFQPDANVERAAVPDPYKWQLGALFMNDDAFESALAQAQREREALATHQGKMGTPTGLLNAMQAYFDARLKHNYITLYANLRVDTANQDTKAQSLYDRSLQAMNAFMAESGFVRQEILALDDAALERAYAKEPKLAEYRPYIDEIRRRRDRVLGAEAERVLALLGDNLWAEIDLNELPSGHERTFGALLGDLPLPTITDADGKQVQLTFSNLGRYRASTDRRVRQETMEKFFATLSQYRHALASTFGSQIQLNVTLARARGYDTALEAYLEKDNIDPAVYTTLIEAIRANVAPLHRYVALRKKVLGLDAVHVYDLYTPLVPAVERDFPYAEAQKILPEALAPLGEEYVKVLSEGLAPENGWIDVYPHKQKESGAFCSSIYGVHPYVKMNYMDDYDGLSTLAHEYGHALHAHLTMTHQPYVTFGYPAMVAETASTLNEKLLVDHLLSKAQSKEEKLALLGEMAENIRTTIYRQALFAEFELAAHTAAEQGTPLTADWLNEKYAELIRAYYGPEFTIGEHDAVEWAFIPHFYYKYYMYAYALGLSTGIALGEQVQTGGPEARDAYLTLLKTGSSKAPLEAVRAAGVDLTRPDAVKAAADYLDRILGEMEQLLTES